MKVGDLVVVRPAKGNYYIISKLEAYENSMKLPNCVLLYNVEDGTAHPMDKKWIDVVS